MVLETERLALRHLCAGDAAFILELVTDPDWLRFIGDRGVRTAEDARGYIETGPMKLYERLGFTVVQQLHVTRLTLVVVCHRLLQ